MANDLYGDGVGEVLSALDSATLPADVEQLVLTALLAPDELSSDAALNERVKRPMIEPDATDPSTALAPVYLNSISIRGFRGVGNEAVSLDLQPHPGLTLVTGRNGSGKSSIAEALEMLMSGGSARWNGRNVVWRDSWQHLDAEETVIAAKFVCEGTPGNISVTQRTSKDTLPANAPSAQVEWPGASYADLGACGWAEALGQFRPFLSYNELGGLLEGTGTDQYNKLSSVLDLTSLESAVKALTDERISHKKQTDAIDKDRKSVLAIAESIDDARAKRCVKLLKARDRDVVAIGHLLETASSGLGDEVESGPRVQLLTELSRLVAPDPNTLMVSIQDFLEADQHVQDVAVQQSEQSLVVAQLLDAALHAHEVNSSDVCFVCEQGVIAKEWRPRTQQRVLDLRAVASLAAAARDRVKLASQTVAGAIGATEVDAASVREVGGLSDGLYTDEIARLARRVDELRSALRLSVLSVLSGLNSGLGGGPRAQELVDSIREVSSELQQVTMQLAHEAGSMLARIEQRWQRIAVPLREWLRAVQLPRNAPQRFADLKAAEEWLKGAVEVVRNARFVPLQQQAGEIWKTLRRDSNVDLSSVSLNASGRFKSVDLTLAVDGRHEAGIGVLSQGEIHAMALSLFLPRATLAQSPFKFLVIDDPVQAMDPGKVEALAMVLAEVATQRQVIVFTHDERLAEAVRRLKISARIWKVDRSEGGVMGVALSLNPVDQALKEARDLLKDSKLPEVVAVKVVPNLCRQAIEAACDEVIRGRRMAAGMRASEVDRLLQDAHRVISRLALAMFDNADRHGDVMARLARVDRKHADVVSIANRGSHHEVLVRADLEGLRDGTRAVCKWISTLDKPLA
jgi:recombinational DNA repair ATPase RecF